MDQSHADRRAELVEVVRRWQSGQDGSSLLRGAARVITGVPHYFSADFIEEYERRAAQDGRARSQARLLIEEITRAETRSDREWHLTQRLPGDAFAGRGIKSKPDHDNQILSSLAQGRLVMPLWGFSLREDVATGYGDRFLFRIEGPFHGIAAWLLTGDQQDQAEIIASGSYEVRPEDHGDDKTIVALREIGPVPVSTELMAMLDRVQLGGVYRTNTLIPIGWGEMWSEPAAPPGLKVRVVRIGTNGPDVEALEDLDDMKAGTVFFCPAGNLIPVD
jgi:hypothetical protein